VCLLTSLSGQCDDVGLAVQGFAVVGFAVVGAAVTVFAVVGAAVVGLTVVGAAVVGAAVVGADVQTGFAIFSQPRICMNSLSIMVNMCLR
jgi:hypothetical protein